MEEKLTFEFYAWHTTRRMHLRIFTKETLTCKLGVLRIELLCMTCSNFVDLADH